MGSRKVDAPEHLGKTVRRLREGYSLSLGQLSEQSGVAKSIIAAIEKNETNPTIGTLVRLSNALKRPVVDFFGDPDRKPALIEHVGVAATPLLMSADRKCTLRILGSLDVVEQVQWYDFEAEPGGRLESDPHPAGSVENLSVRKGRLRVTVDGHVAEAGPGETLRYRGDVPHMIDNVGEGPAHALMVNLLFGGGI